MEESKRPYAYYDIVMAVFVTVLLLSNIASSAKIIDLGVQLFGLDLAFDAGTLLFPLSYIFGDILTEVYGYKRARRVIWVGFAAAALMAVMFGIIGALPGQADWQNYAGQEAYNAILGGVANGGIIIASLSAYFAGEFSNSVTLAKIKVWMEGRMLWVRTIGSTLIGQAVDTIIFVLVATLFGVFDPAIILTLIVSNYIFKVAIEVLMTPATYLITDYLKQAENEDYYDYDTNFNPFKVNA